MSLALYARKKPGKKEPGAPAELVNRIRHLGTLLQHLPDGLPLDPPDSTFHFGFDQDDLDDGGPWMALNRNLETCFQRHLYAGEDKLTIKYRSSKFLVLIKMLKEAVGLENDAYRTLIKDRWVERIIDAAERAGARIPYKKRHAPVASSVPSPKRAKGSLPAIYLDDSDIELLETPPQVGEALNLDSQWNGEEKEDATHVSVKATRQLTLNFKKITKEEANEQSRKTFKTLQKRTDAWKVHKEKTDAVKAARCRELTRLRVGRLRARKGGQKKKKKEIVKFALNSVSEAASTEVDTARVSRVATSKWKAKRNGRLGGTVQSKHKRTNYYHPFLWTLINTYFEKYDRSATKATRALRDEHPALFSHLHKGTMQKWIEPKSKPPHWSEVTMQNIKREHSLTGSGRTGILSRHPEIVDAIKTALTGLRTNGVPLSVTLGRCIILVIIEELNSAIIENTLFKCSEFFVQNFFASVMNMTPRAATRAAAHIPVNWEEICERTFFRLVNIIKAFDIPLSLVINMDQTGILYIPGFKHTFETKGVKQVNVIGKDEKRGFTLCISSTADGQFLPLQQVCGGKTSRSCPSASSAGMKDALTEGFDFTVAASETNPSSHYSTLKTMKEFVNKIFKPYYQQVLRDNPRLPSNQRAVLYIDAYPVHISRAFLDFLDKEHPYILPIFVPANCTGVFQPADVGLQRVIKHTIKQFFVEELVKSQRQHLANGTALEDVLFSNSITVLRNASVQAMLSVYKHMTSVDGCEIIKMAWRKCSVKGYNLSGDKLTDPSIRLNDLEAYLDKDKTLADEIATRARKRNQIFVEDGLEAELTPEGYDEPNKDDAAVPVSSVVESVLKIKIPNHCTRYCTHSDRIKQSDTHPGLIPSSEEEDIWAYNDEGVTWATAGVPMAEANES